MIDAVEHRDISYIVERTLPFLRAFLAAALVEGYP